MTTLPKLYKKSSDGTLLEWEISVDGNTITTRYGQVGGAIQTATDTIKEGKNLGKKNATTAAQQALSEAKSKHEKQRKTKGYVDSVEAAQAGERDALVEGGIDPMLAHKWRDHKKKVKFPALAQPKLDGIRCIAVVEDGQCTLWSRTRKPITGVPHVARAVEELAKYVGGDFVLDGELYNHDLKKDFEKITSFVRQVEPQPGHEVVQYHIYDTVMDAPFDFRRTWISTFIPPRHYDSGYAGPLKVVETMPVVSEDDVLESFAEYMAAGYEGCMVRNSNSKYANKRSYDLQKVKEMLDAEFEIVGVREGRGKMEGKAVFQCKASNGEVFDCKMKGSLDNLVQYVVDPSLAIGKLLTVEYQNETAYGIPRFPVGVRIRDTLQGTVL